MATPNPDLMVQLALFFPESLQQLTLAALFGLMIGSERAFRNKVASLRTFSMISTGACLFSMISISALQMSPADAKIDITRIAAQVVTGIGFLGGGVIFKTADRVEGITTAAMIWLTAAIGMCCGFNQIFLALYAFMIWATLNVLSILLHRLIDTVQETVDRTKAVEERNRG